MLTVMGSNGPSGYNILRSLRFRSSASAYLSRTPAANGNRQILTWSGWVKRGSLSDSGYMYLYGAYPGTSATDTINFINGTLRVWFNGSSSADLVTTQVFRDPSAWYHIIVAIDTTQATAANRIKVYVNGAQVTSFSTATYPSQNYSTFWNSTSYSNQIGANGNGPQSFFDGYLAEVNFIDGQALTPSSFGQTDAVTGVWTPKKYTGTYGTNGFYLPFSDNTSATTLAYDKSGNGNNWTANNISTTAGATYDSMTDVPTLTSATAANYCVLNPLDNAGTAISGSANLNAYTANCPGRLCGTMAVNSGKWYWEAAFTGNDTGQTAMFGICQDFNNAQAYVTYGYYATGGKYNFASGSSAYGASWTNNDIIGVALDMDAGTIAFYKNGVAQGTAFTGLTGGWKPAFSSDYGTSGRGIVFWANFGQRPFSYTPPTGFVALNTYNLPTPTILAGNKFYAASLYNGNSSTQAVTNAGGFKPDLVWIKARSASTNNKLTDSVRGVTKAIISNTADLPTTDTNGLTAFNSNGFTVGSDSVYNNGTGPVTYVGWQWQAGQGTNVTNTNGSITSTVSVSQKAGFSIVTFTGNGSISTVGHGLGVAPAFIILNDLSYTYPRTIYHSALGNTQYTALNGAGAPATDSSFWNNTSPTSSVFTIATNAYVNINGANFVAYCWAPIAGFSAFGSYVGNSYSAGTDGAFVYTGFRPAFVLVKASANGYDWVMYDSARNTYNVAQKYLNPNTANSENAGGNVADIDFVSNGFKLRNNSTSAQGTNIGNTTYIYAAFAENPFKYANAR